MRRTLCTALPALLVLAGWASPGRAEVIVRVPFFSLTTGPRAYPGSPVVYVRVGGLVDVQVRKASRGPVAPPRVVTGPVAPPARDVQPPPPPQEGTVIRAMTIAEFARTFKPAPGTYEVYFVHPVKKRPVKVVFTLPEGYPRKVKAHPRQLVFDYGRRHWVRIRFLHNGTATVTAR
jgi:hypothetical protein